MQISGLPMPQILHGINFLISFSLLLMLFEYWLNYDHAIPYLHIYTHARMYTHTRTYTSAHTHITFLTHSHTQYKSDHMLIRFFWFFHEAWSLLALSGVVGFHLPYNNLNQTCLHVYYVCIILFLLHFMLYGNQQKLLLLLPELVEITWIRWDYLS